MKLINQPFIHGFGVCFLLAAIICLITCQDQPPEIFPLPHLTSERKKITKNGDVRLRKKEYFVIAHPPKDSSQLKALVKKYNDSTLFEKELGKHAFYKRVFYKETKFTPRDYREANRGYFNHDRIEFHGRDIIISVTWRDNGKYLKYRFYQEGDLP